MLDIPMLVCYSSFMVKFPRKGEGVMKTMIYLDGAVHMRLKYMALDERTSMAELIRQAVDEYLAKHPGRREIGGGKK